MDSRTLIRAATAADLPGLCALRDAPAQHQTKLQEAAHGAARFLVAADAGVVVGFATLFLSHPLDGPPKSHLPKLSDCFVSESHRSHGIGAALVARRESLTREAGYDRLYVSVDRRENPRWFAFFLRRGYVPLQPEPYRKQETRLGADGHPTIVTAWRQDLCANLQFATLNEERDR